MIKLDLKKLDLKLMDDVFEESILKNFSEKCKYFPSYFHGKSINSCHTRTCVSCIFGREKKIENVWHIYDLDLLKYHQWIYELCSNFIIITAVKWAHLLSYLHNWLITKEFLGCILSLSVFGLLALLRGQKTKDTKRPRNLEILYF